MGQSGARYSAFDTAAYFLGFKDRTRQEIIDKLKEKGYSDTEIDDAVFKLLEYGYINDERYALSYIRSNIKRKSLKLNSMELANKGIDKELISEAVSQIEVCEADNIYSVLSSRFRNVDFKDEKSRRRVISYFMRRGYKYEDIRTSLAKIEKNGEF